MNYVSQSLVAMDEKCCLIKWNAIEDGTVAYYNVYVQTNSDESPSLLTSGITKSEFLSGPLRHDKEYKFFVTSVNTAGNESELSEPIKMRVTKTGESLSTTDNFYMESHVVDSEPLVIESKYITKDSRLSFRGEGELDIKYLFGSEVDFIQYKKEPGSSILSARYVRNDITVIEKSVDLSTVLSLDTLSMPLIELAKHGTVWDFHVSNKDKDGNSIRKTLSLATDRSLLATKIRFNNKDVKNYMLIDLVMHELSIYKSSLEIVNNSLDKLDGIIGNSSPTALSPIIKNGGLQIGADASISIKLHTGGVKLDEGAMFIKWRFDSLPINKYSVEMEWKLGSNTISYNSYKLFINGVYVCDWGNTLPEMWFVIMTNPLGTDAKLLWGGRAFDCEFYTTSPIKELYIKTGVIEEEFILGDFSIQASENYLLDSVPPGVVTHINAKTGNKEIFIDWKESSAEDINGYNVYVDGRVHNLDLIKETSYQITGLQNSIEYMVTVTAVDKSGNESVSAEALKLMTLTDPTQEISNLTIDTSEAGVHLQFTPPIYPGLDKIRIYRESMSNLGLQLLNELSYNEAEYLDEPKPPVGKYMYMITTVSLSGIETNGTKIYYNIL